MLTIPPAVTELPLVLGCSSLCSAGPPAGCRPAGKASLRVVSAPGEDARDKLLWTWGKGVQTSPAELGSPTATTAYALCVYAADGASLLFETYVPAHPTRWKASGGGTGFLYKDALAATAGVQKLLVKSGAAKKAKMALTGKGIALPDPPLGDVPLPVVATS